MATSLNDSVVLVTGAARGIGAEAARRLAARGARLALLGLEPERLAALASELGVAHRWWECDVTDQSALDEAVAGVVTVFGRIDVVLANAGIANNGTVAVTPAEALAHVVDVNLTGVIRTVKATLPHLVASRGYCLLVSSVAAFAAVPGLATYAATKAGVEQFATVLRLELARKGVAVGSAHPCWIDTDLVRDLQRDLASFDQMIRLLPGPLGAVTSVGACAETLVRAIERRSRRVYVPASMRALAWLRPLAASPLVERLIVWRGRALLEQLEREAPALRRSFGVNSAGLGSRK